MSELSEEMLVGARSIAEFMFGAGGKSELRRVYRLTSEVDPEDRLPTFRLGGGGGPLCARKARLVEYIEQQERRDHGSR